MSKFALVVAALAPMAALAAPRVDANLTTPQAANNIDLGCYSGDLRATKYPTTHYDEATHERIMYTSAVARAGSSWAPTPTPGRRGTPTSSRMAQ